LDGIINIYKEKGYTSHDVVQILRRLSKQRKVGHTGTLDPEAEGVLPVCFGKATKVVEYIIGQNKQYKARLCLGITTTTEDHTGEIIKRRPVEYDTERIKTVLQSFIGEYQQIPPMYSAIKVQGKKLYELAREGKEIKREPRTVYIYNIQITKWLFPNQVEFIVDCSKGTYIRTLCADVGEKLGCGGHMSGLLRTAVGDFSITNSYTLDQLEEKVNTKCWDSVLISIEELFQNYPKVYVTPSADRSLQNGHTIYEKGIDPIRSSPFQENVVCMYTSTGDFIGLYQGIQQEYIFYKPVKMLI